ncbi:MAG: UDP-N-acetylglucosamine 1-carboxyvinyltransferase [Lachnospiraceae bacterium]
MKQIVIRGGVPLQGEVSIQGSKNAVLPILAATILTNGHNVIRNCPRIADVTFMIELLRVQGAKIHWEGNTLFVDTTHLVKAPFTAASAESMRSSVFLVGAMLARFSSVCMPYPGGCVIGDRPINWHVKHLSDMGAIFCDTCDLIEARVTKLKGCQHNLVFKSVGVTENLVLAATLAEGETRIVNAALEPEIDVLCEFLASAGAHIVREVNGDIEVIGTEAMGGGDITIPGDRIVAGTYALACVATNGKVFLRGAPTMHMEALIEVLNKLGASVLITKEGLYVEHGDEIHPIDYIQTEVYPGFPTDLQSQLVTVLAKADGCSVVKEAIFSNRFRIVKQLKKMGAAIEIIEDCAIINGVTKLHATDLVVEELRGGAALVIAGACTKGITYLDGCGYIFRGYENICRDLTELGVRIYSE